MLGVRNEKSRGRGTTDVRPTVVSLSFIGGAFALVLAVWALRDEPLPVPPEPHLFHQPLSTPGPTTIQECFTYLESWLPPQELSRIRSLSEKDMGSLYHMSVGLTIRNYWGIATLEPLYWHLYELGLRHPDDMSGTVLTSFWRHQHGLPLKVEEQVRQYQEYWRVTVEPSIASNSDCATLMGFLGWQPGEFPDGKPRYITLATCCSDSTFWAWEVDRGWYRPEGALLRDWQNSGRPLASECARDPSRDPEWRRQHLE